MKYLKPFNENIENLKEELLDFCESNLAYLLDEAELQVIHNAGGWSELHLVRILLNQPKIWNEIKDYMIPFLTRLEAKYEISNLPFKDSSSDIRLYIALGDDRPNTNEIYPNVPFKKAQIKDLINDNVSFTNARISDMRFYVKGYKTEKKGILTKIKSLLK